MNVRGGENNIKKNKEKKRLICMQKQRGAYAPNFLYEGNLPSSPFIFKMCK